MMNDQKIENLLNLSLDATEAEREKSGALQVGYDPVDQTWDLIIKYSGDLDTVRNIAPDVVVIELINEYAILKMRESLIPALAGLPNVEYIEKPKRLTSALSQARAASCLSAVQAEPYNLFGTGVIVAVIDSGVDYAHPDFRNEDGSTRIKFLWDQTIPGNPPGKYMIGTEYTSEQINEALDQPNQEQQYQVVPSRDINGHGTGVLGIAAGNGSASNGEYRGMAPRSDIIVVKLGLPNENSFPRTTELMLAVDYVVSKSIELQQPAAINLSFGTTYGSHLGDSLTSTFLDDISNMGRIAICVGTGNEGGAAGHTSGMLVSGRQVDVELGVGPNETSLSVQLWKHYVDQFDVAIVHPSGIIVGPFQEILGAQRFVIGNTQLLLYYGEPSPYSMAQEIFVDFIPVDVYIDSGIWSFRLIPKTIVLGNYNMWLPSEGILNTGTRFYASNANNTLTVPSTAAKVVSVAAYDSRLRTYAAFSGRGVDDYIDGIKPDLAAPGVDITTTAINGGYVSMTGTSFATPFVTGAAALLMERGVVQGRDPYMYGEKVKASLIRGAQPLNPGDIYPNNQLGYGTLCVQASINF